MLYLSSSPGSLSYNLCQFLLDNIDRRLFLFTQQSAVPWNLTDLHTSRGARAVQYLSLSTPPLVPHLTQCWAVHDLGLTTPPSAAPLHTSHGARALHGLSLSTPSSVDNNPPTTSPHLPPWPVDTSRVGQEPRPPKSEPPPVCQPPSVSPHRTPVQHTRLSQLSNTHRETCIISTLWLLFSGNWHPMHAVRTICDAREQPGSLKMFLRLLRSQ